MRTRATSLGNLHPWSELGRRVADPGGDILDSRHASEPGIPWAALRPSRLGDTLTRRPT
jgi:hypothetical protein